MRGVSGDDPAGGAGSGVARAGRRGYEKPGAVARHEQWLAASSLLAGSAERVRSGSWADNATVERREAASRLHGTVHASQAWCRASPARQLKAVRLPALLRPPHFGAGGDAVAQVTAGSPAEASATAAQKGWRRRSGGDAEARRMQQPGCTNAPRERDRLRGQATQRAV